MGLTAVAVFLTRMDLAALIVIPLAALPWELRRDVRAIALGLGALAVPLVA